MNVNWQTIGKAVGAVVLIVSMITGVLALDQRWAKASDVSQSLSVLSTGIYIKIDTDRLNDLMDRKALVRAKLANDPGNQDYLDEMDYLKNQIEYTRKRIQENTGKLGQ